MGFCGHSGSGKTTLISKLIQEFSREFHVGYLKHDAHHFEMDHPGKDTFVAWDMGASAVKITDPHHQAEIRRSPEDLVSARKTLLGTEMLFIEGYKLGPHPKVLLLNEEMSLLTEDDLSPFSPVIAVVGPFRKPPARLLKSISPDTPYFHRDDVQGISQIIRDYFRSQIPPLYGLVLGGGYSRRMKQDKALMNYHGKSQVEHLFEMLSFHCEKSFVSARQNQWESPIGNLEMIYDRFLDFGPLGGILSAMTQHPEAAWLVVACDLPHLDHATLKHLVDQRAPFKIATAFDSSDEKGLPEPLCAIYEPKSRMRLLDFLGLRIECPRKILLNSGIRRLKPIRAHALDNINSPLEREQYLKESHEPRIYN